MQDDNVVAKDSVVVTTNGSYPVDVNKTQGTRCMLDTITKLQESGDLCDNITEFGVAEGLPEPTGRRLSTATPNSVILPCRSPDEGCFVFISYCLMILCH